jgi:hypothetical protein
MMPIREAFVPLSVLIAFRSFGADQCASSEGFLVTFTPETRRIRIFPLDFLSEYLSEVHCFHHCFFENKEQRKNSSRAVQSYTTMPTRVSDFGRETFLADLYSERPVSVGIVPMGSSSTESFIENFDVARTQDWYLGEVLGIDLMNPGSLGILVALKPTDEGRIGTGRNTQNAKE